MDLKVNRIIHSFTVRTESKIVTNHSTFDGIMRRMLMVLFLLVSVMLIPSRTSYAIQVDYQSLQEEPLETAYRKLASPGDVEWDEEEMVTGGAPTIISGMKWPLKTGVIAGTFNRYRTKGHRRHHGIDLLASKGTPILASLDGIVEVVSNGGKGVRGYGRVVIINHSNQLWTLYSHCSTLNVMVGQYVTQGQTIATVGSTGRATTNHLHFEIRNSKGTPLDPMKYLPKEGALPEAFYKKK